jgi:hypothetical protein
MAGKQITTIEGLKQGETLHKVQQAWIEHQVPQCGYCQSGQIMAAVALLAENPKPTDADIDAIEGRVIQMAAPCRRVDNAMVRAIARAWMRQLIIEVVGPYPVANRVSGRGLHRLPGNGFRTPDGPKPPTGGLHSRQRPHARCLNRKRPQIGGLFVRDRSYGANKE